MGSFSGDREEEENTGREITGTQKWMVRNVAGSERGNYGMSNTLRFQGKILERVGVVSHPPLVSIRMDIEPHMRSCKSSCEAQPLSYKIVKFKAFCGKIDAHACIHEPSERPC